MIVAVEVGVALSRPPKLDRLSRVLVSVGTHSDGSRLGASEQEARLVASYLAHRPDVVMVVSAEIVEILEV